jgi:hypothetical protein
VGANLQSNRSISLCKIQTRLNFSE